MVGLLLRHTAAAIGVAMGYLVLIEGVFARLPERAQPWLVKLNFDAFVRHDTTYYVNECSTGQDGSYSCTSIEKTLSFEHGAWYLGILAVVLVLLGGAGLPPPRRQLLARRRRPNSTSPSVITAATAASARPRRRPGGV